MNLLDAYLHTAVSTDSAKDLWRNFYIEEYYCINRRSMNYVLLLPTILFHTSVLFLCCVSTPSVCFVSFELRDYQSLRLV